MTDYFALLGVERRPWLNEDELQAKFHALTLRLHPDAGADNLASSGFADINRAYQTLRDPSRRLQHLLQLESGAATTNHAIPPAVQQLFTEVHATTRDAQHVLLRMTETSSALARGLLHAQVLHVRAAVARLIAALAEVNRAARSEAEILSSRWDPQSAEHVAAAQRVQSTFTFANRWLAQLQEIAFQLSQF